MHPFLGWQVRESGWFQSLKALKIIVLRAKKPLVALTANKQRLDAKKLEGILVAVAKYTCNYVMLTAHQKDDRADNMLRGCHYDASV
jgi:hypothetical protein